MSALAHTVECTRQLTVQSVRRSPKYWGRWFAPLGDGYMKETNLNIFYHLGAAVSSLYAAISVEKKVWDLFSEIYFAHEWVSTFLKETEDFKALLEDSRVSAGTLLGFSEGLINDMRSGNADRNITQAEVSALGYSKEQLESNFERECRKLPVFTVTPKALYDTRRLMEKTEEQFPENVRKVLPLGMLYDLHQAGRCLAFDTPTACAFHIFRATETLIRRYYEVLAGKPWPHQKRDWFSYIEELNKFPNVNKDATMRLDEIRKFERNPSIHPETVVPLEKAPRLFELCSGVIYTMAEEIRKLSPAP
jgi:hypothetical protein